MSRALLIASRGTSMSRLYHLSSASIETIFNLQVYPQLGSSRYTDGMGTGKVNGRTQLPTWLNAAALLITSWMLIAALSLQVRPGAELVAVAFPPWWGTQQVFLAAGSANAAIVRTTAIPVLLVVRPDDHDGLTRLRQAGAWLTLDPRAVAACLRADDFEADGSANKLRIENDFRTQ